MAVEIHARHERPAGSEEQFRLLVEGIRDYAIVMLDPSGRVMSWNAGAERMIGYRADEIVGQHCSKFYSPDDIARGWPEHELQVTRAEGRFEDAGWRIRKDGSSFWAKVISTALYSQDGPDGQLLGYARIIQDMSGCRGAELAEETSRSFHRSLAMVAQEVRTPLAPIRNAMSILRMQELKNARLSSCRDIVDRNVAALSRLVEDLLDISRLSSGRLLMFKGPLDLATIVSHAVAVCGPLIAERRQELRVELPSQPLWVHGDVRRLSQVVLNLLNNASAVTPEGGAIKLLARQCDGYVELAVRDAGIGFDAGLLPRIFDLFVQDETVTDPSPAGLRIGLTLVKEIVSLHGGSVEASSAGPQLGNELRVRLPALEDKCPAMPKRLGKGA